MRYELQSSPSLIIYIFFFVFLCASPSNTDPKEQPDFAERRVRVFVVTFVGQPSVQGRNFGGDPSVRHHQSQARIVSATLQCRLSSIRYNNHDYCCCCYYILTLLLRWSALYNRTRLSAAQTLRPRVAVQPRGDASSNGRFDDITFSFFFLSVPRRTLSNGRRMYIQRGYCNKIEK